MTQKANSEAMTDLVARLQNMNQGDFAKLVQPLQDNGRLQALLQDEYHAYTRLGELATTEQQKAQIQRKQQIMKHAITADPYYQRLALRLHASPETMLRLYTESMKAHMGPAFQKALKEGVMGFAMEQQFKAITGFFGSRADFEKIKESTYVLMNSANEFSANSVYEALRKSMEANVKNLEDDAKLNADLAKQKTKSSEMFTQLYKKWLVKILKQTDKILVHLRGWWASILLGGGEETGDGKVELVLGEIKMLMAKLSTATGDERKKILEEIDSKLGGIASHGGTVADSLAPYMTDDLPEDIKQILEKHVQVAQSSGSGADLSGVGGNMDMASKLVNAANAIVLYGRLIQELLVVIIWVGEGQRVRIWLQVEWLKILVFRKLDFLLLNYSVY
jgi:hypothetical protein